MGRSRSRSHSPSPHPRDYGHLPTDSTILKAADSDSTATNSSDEFDWDAEEGSSDPTRDKAKAKRMRRLWLLFMKLSHPVRIIIFGLVGSAIFITPWLVFFFHFRSISPYKHVMAWSIWFSVTWGAGAVTGLLVNLLPRFIIFVIFAVYGKPPEQVKTQLELMMAVSGWLKLALDISWAWVALSVIRSLIKPPGTYWVYVNRAMQALFAAGMILLAEKIFLQFVAIRFHQKALADRLLENRLGLRALDKLSVAPTTSRKRNTHKNASRSGSVDMLGNGGDSRPMSPIGPSPLHSGPSSPDGTKEKTQIRSANAKNSRKKKAINKQILGAIGQVALKDSRFNREGEIGSLYSARQLARQLFSSLSSVTPPRSHLIVQDFYPYFRDVEDAATAFHLFDKDGNGDISKKEMREAVQRIYRERKALTASLKDMSSAVAKLDGVLLFIALLGIGFACLLIFNRHNTVESLVPLATIVLGMSFVFGRSAQTLFESLIFIFSTHPFDVGDLVIIDDSPLFVKEFGLFSTVFRRVDGQEILAPNALLSSAKLIHNVRRSNSMWETTNLTVAYNTPLEVIEQLKSRLRQYMADNNREWGTPGCEVNIDKMEYQNDIQLIIAIEHRANWQNWGGRWERRTKFMRHMKVVLEELEIGYKLPVQPVTFHPASVPPPWAHTHNDMGNAGNVGGQRARGNIPPPAINVGRF